MRGAAKLIGTPLPRQEVQAGTPRILAPLDLIAIRAVALHAHLLHPASLPGQLVLGFAAVLPQPPPLHVQPTCRTQRQEPTGTGDRLWPAALAHPAGPGTASALASLTDCRATIKTVSPATISDTSTGGISLRRAADCQVRSRHRRWPERPDFTGGCPPQMLGRRCYLKLNILIPAVAV